MTDDLQDLLNTEWHLALIKATCNIASNLRGGFVFSPDEFLERVIAISPDIQAEFWMRQAPLSVSALFREYPEIARELKGRGVLAWVADDGFVRVINFEWLKTKAEIQHFVTGEPQPGRCRFCTAIEPPGSLELRELDGVHLHQPCRQFWNKWTRLAQKTAAGA